MLRGTGSNIYNASLARTLVGLGHEVHLLCQERQARDLSFVDAIGSWRDGELRIERLREPVRCTAYLPDIGRTLPVYVADEYEGFDAVPFPELGDPELERYLTANVEAVRDVVRSARPELALANHAVMGPAILARGLAGVVPYAVTVHGSALEYVVRPHRERFLAFAREGLERAAAVLVGSRHTAESLWEVVPEPWLRARTRLGPPGVDVEAFHPRTRADAAEGLETLVARLEAGDTATWGGEPGAPDAVRSIDADDPTVAYVGKLIVSKGVDLLLAAWPLVAERIPGARLCVVGFGSYRDGLRSLGDALAQGDLAAAREIAERGRELEGGERGALAYLQAFLDGLTGTERERYLRAAAAAFERVHYTGRLEHSDLPDLLPACDAQVVPSTFPEAFGMVAAEAACCGVLPLSADHSGLREVTDSLAPALDESIRPLLSFSRGDGAVREIAVKLVEWLELPLAQREPAAMALSEAARGMYAWEAVANGVIAAAMGRLDELPRAAPPPASGV